MLSHWETLAYPCDVRPHVKFSIVASATRLGRAFCEEGCCGVSELVAMQAGICALDGEKLG